MRHLYIILCFMLAGLFIFSCSSVKNISNSEKYLWIKEDIDSKKFKIEVTDAYPITSRVIHMMTDYSLALRNDSVFSYLPYFGRAYVAPLDPMKGGFVFDLPIKNLEIKYSEKRGYDIKFEAQNSEDYYRFHVNISPTGYSDIGVTTNKKSYIRFTGEMVK